MKHLERIWQKPIYLPYLQPELTDEILEQAEQNLGYKLPKELVELLKIQNGGYISKTLEESLHQQIYGIGPHYPSLTDIEWEDYKDWVSFELEGLIPFDGDGHWHLCLDYRKNKINPQITFIDTECDDQEIIAESFADYLSLLTIEIEHELVITTDRSIHDIIKNIEQILNITFETPDNFANGYDQYRSAIGNDWIWLSSNLVPYGFIRPDEDRYNELIELSRKKALKFPDLKATSILISFSNEEIMELSLDKLKANGIEVSLLENLITDKFYKI